MHILFVCTCNTCRSAMAEGLLREMARVLELPDMTVSSAGVAAYPGDSASIGACSVMGERGVDIYNHTATRLSAAHVEAADLILCMGSGHLQATLAAVPAAQGKADTLLHYVTGTQENIDDPFGGDREVYLATLNQLELALLALIIKLHPEKAAQIEAIYKFSEWK